MFESPQCTSKNLERAPVIQKYSGERGVPNSPWGFMARLSTVIRLAETSTGAFFAAGFRSHFCSAR